MFLKGCCAYHFWTQCCRCVFVPSYFGHGSLNIWICLELNFTLIQAVYKMSTVLPRTLLGNVFALSGKCDKLI